MRIDAWWLAYFKNVDEYVREAAKSALTSDSAQSSQTVPEDILRDANRYRKLRMQNNDDCTFAVIKNAHFDVFNSPEELDQAIDNELL